MNKSLFEIQKITQSQNFLEEIFYNCNSKVIPKNEFLPKAGEHCTYAFFVKKGVLRQFVLSEEGKESIVLFALENWILADRASTYFQEPSEFYIQAVESSKVYFLDEKFIQELSMKNTDFFDLNTKMLHNHIRHLQNRIKHLLSLNSRDKYLQFVKQYPDLYGRVPQSMIASYLGMTPETLSRIRREASHE